MDDGKRIFRDRLLLDNGFDIDDELLMTLGPPGEDSWEDGGLVGVAAGMGPARLVYDYDLLVGSLAGTYKDIPEDERWEAAAEWVDHNTVRGLDYESDPGKPLTMHRLRRDLEGVRVGLES